MCMINRSDVPNWVLKLEVEDLAFIRRFVLLSGSLKDLAKEYDITYPTMRIRLDKLIDKINIHEDPIDDDFIKMVKEMSLDGKFEFEVAKEIILKYRKSL